MADTPQNIFDFKHVDTTLSKGTSEMLKNLYAFYHKKITAVKSCTAKEKPLFVTLSRAKP